MKTFSPLRGVVSHTFPNGLRVLLKADHAWPVVSAQAWVRVGSMDERAPQAGLSHILEHMVFKGTEHFSAAQISRWVEALGGAINAETSREYTHYYIDAPKEGAQKAVQLLGELLHRATIDPDEWSRERLVVLEELKRRNDDPDSLLWDLLNEALYKEERLRRPVIGFVETVSSVQRDIVYAFYREYYRAGRCVVVIAGDFNPHQMLRWLHTAFDAMPPGAGPMRSHTLTNGYAAKHLAMRKPVQQVYAALGFPTPPSSHPDHEALDLLAAMLGEGRSSRLVQTLREKKKLVSSIHAANYGHEGPGLFSIFAECSPARRTQLRPAVERVVQSMLGKLTAQEVSRAKNLIQNAWLQSFETAHQQASTLGLYALDNQLQRLETYLPRILSVTPSQLADVAARYFKRLPLSSAVIAA